MVNPFSALPHHLKHRFAAPIFAPKSGGRPKIYDVEVIRTEKRLGALSEATRRAVLTIGASRIDRVLAARKIDRETINRGTPKTNAAIKAPEPGWKEAHRPVLRGWPRES